MDGASYGAVKARLTSSASRDTIAVGVLGQSVEQNNVPQSDATAYPQAFRSLRNKGVHIPMAPQVTRLGGNWPKVYDDLYDWGYDLAICNGAISGMDFVLHACGQVQTRNNSWPYYQRRSPESPYDLGDFGEIITPSNGFMFVCTTGRKRYATYQPLTGAPNNGIQFTGVGTSAASAPNFSSGFTGAITGGNLLTVTASANGAIEVGHVIYNSSGTTALGTVSSFGTGTGGTGTYNLTSATNTASSSMKSTVAVGGTVVDGTITWTRIDEFSVGTLLTGNIINYTQEGRGFDPLGVCRRILNAVLSVRGAKRHLIIMRNAQSSLGYGTPTAPTYRSTIRAMADFFAASGVDVLPGLSNFSPQSGTTAQYDGLSYGVANAILDAQADAASGVNASIWGNIYTGANLYQLMGTTGPMGYSTFTGAIASGVLTVSATTGGAIEVGHRISNNGVLVGTVTSLGTYNGTTGTVNLSGATDTSSTALKASGQFLQINGSADVNIHLTGAGSVGPDVGGVSCAAKHDSDSLKAILPKRALF